jgi:beta-lactamase class A
VKQRGILRLALVGLAFAATSAAQTATQAGGAESLSQLRDELQAIRQAFPGQISVYMKNLSTGEEIALDADTVYETFSVIKLAVAAEVLRDAEAGKFSLGDRIAITPADRRLPSGAAHPLPFTIPSREWPPWWCGITVAK